MLLSWYLSLTIARPILRLAGAAERHARGQRPHRRGAAAAAAARGDEVGELAVALSEFGARAVGAHGRDRALRRRRGARDQEPAVVDPQRHRDAAAHRGCRRKQRRLLAIIAEDVGRLDRLISDISDASRLDAELSRVAAEPVDVAPILRTLAEIDEATRERRRPAAGAGRRRTAGLVVQAVEDRLVQVLRNLIGNAQSFCPPRRPHPSCAPARPGGMVEISVEDEGPGIPEAKLEHIFDRFYSERPQGEQLRPAFRARPVDQPADRRGAAGADLAENRRDASGRVGARFIVPPAAAAGDGSRRCFRSVIMCINRQSRMRRRVGRPDVRPWRPALRSMR